MTKERKARCRWDGVDVWCAESSEEKEMRTARYLYCISNAFTIAIVHETEVVG